MKSPCFVPSLKECIRYGQRSHLRIVKQADYLKLETLLGAKTSARAEPLSTAGHIVSSAAPGLGCSTALMMLLWSFIFLDPCRGYGDYF